MTHCTLFETFREDMNVLTDSPLPFLTQNKHIWVVKMSISTSVNIGEYNSENYRSDVVLPIAENIGPIR